MKKIILSVTLALFAAVSMAQTAPATPTRPNADPAKVEAMTAVKTSVKTLKQDEKAFKEAKKSKDVAAITAAKQKIKADRTTLNAAVKSARVAGVKKPLKPVAKQMAKRRQAAKVRTH